MKSLKPKERILNVAMTLFHQQGYNSTGVNQIIEEAAVARASFYQHYKSKEDLALAYLNNRHTQWFEGLRKKVAEEKKSNNQILAAFDYLADMNSKENYKGCAFLNMMSEIQANNTRIYDIIQNHKKQVEYFFEDLIDTPEKSFLVYMLFESCMIESQVHRNQDYITKTKDLLKSKNLI